MTYGALTRIDVGVLEMVMHQYRNQRMRFLEIGIHTGQTARGVRDYCAANWIALEYWGIDSGNQWDGQAPFRGATMVRGDSSEVAHYVPAEFDVMLVDGCHCFNHVILDTVLYSEKVVNGGFLLHHDTAPHVQQTMRDPHGPDTPRFHNSVLEALAAMHWPFPGWSEFATGADPFTDWGGMTAWRKWEDRFVEAGVELGDARLVGVEITH